jgi:methylated-DNA-[protein]-cysteine S-methyltransferase
MINCLFFNYASPHDPSTGSGRGVGDKPPAPSRQRLTTSPRLNEALDLLYTAGPSESATTRAQVKLREALSGVQAREVFYDLLPSSPIGPVLVAVNARGVLAVGFGITERAFVAAIHRKMGVAANRSSQKAAVAIRQLREYLTGKRLAFDLPVDLSLQTDFQQQVLFAAREIPRGEIATYTDIARRIGRPKAARAVGQVLRQNPVPIVIPCHRVLAADGSLRGYLGGGTKLKAQLLKLEGVRLKPSASEFRPPLGPATITNIIRNFMLSPILY